MTNNDAVRLFAKLSRIEIVIPGAEQEFMKPEQQLIFEVFNEQDLRVFDQEVRELLEEPAVLQYVVEPRITAVEVVMIYEQGSLRSASTQRGPVITSVKTILTVPLTFIPLRKERTVPDYLEIRADVYMEREALARLNRERTGKNQPSFSDPRAAVEDSLFQTDPRISVKRPLNYFCSGTGEKAEVPEATHYDLMIALQELGLRVNRPHIKLANGIHEVIDHCRRLRAERENFPFPVEGALIRVNSLDLQAKLPHTSRNRRGTAVLRF
jgi:DNA ligase (NAD+)